ncbi:hypothetical protein [Streptomyces sp. NPDC101132]|uniref:hypothetical protein n=1 Tax=Streptomyces sp. NPDC101132 TaxID=3366110 RepID=UPI0037FC251B
MNQLSLLSISSIVSSPDTLAWIVSWTVRLDALGADGTAGARLEEVLADARAAAVGVDLATVAVMRERRART